MGTIDDLKKEVASSNYSSKEVRLIRQKIMGYFSKKLDKVGTVITASELQKLRYRECLDDPELPFDVAVQELLDEGYLENTDKENIWKITHKGLASL